MYAALGRPWVAILLVVCFMFIGCSNDDGTGGTPDTGPLPDTNQPDTVECAVDADCTSDNACVSGVCAAGVCEWTDVVPDAAPCQTCTCDPEGGVICTAANAGDACADGDCCSLGDSCIACDPEDEDCPEWALACAGAAKSCDDGNDCTVDSCGCDTGVAACGSVDAADDLACDFNENDCTTGDHCENGTCVVGTPADLDDQNPCTQDYCEKGEIKHEALSGVDVQCDDQNECTTDDFCHVGTCTGGDPLVCTVPACASGASCVNGEGCVIDWSPEGAECDDDNECTTADQCDADHQCVGTTNPCDDQNPCTTDTCDPVNGCLNVADPALNGTVCEAGGGDCAGVGSCKDGTCVAGTGDSCDDGNPCTKDTCDAVAGCVNNPWNVITECDDGDPCTSNDQCEGAVCKGTASGDEDVTITCGQKNAFDNDGCCCFNKSQILDMGVQPANTTMECCLTPGFNQGCKDTATIAVSSDGTSWATVDSYATTSFAKPNGGWEAVCTTIPVADSFQYVRGSNDKCYVDKFTCTVPCQQDTTPPATSLNVPIIYDTWLEGTSPHGTHKYLIVGKDGSFPKKRALLRANFDQLAPGTAIKKATLNVYFDYAHTASFASEACIDRDIAVHEVYIPWSEAVASKTKATNTQNWTEELCGINDTDAALDGYTVELWACTDIKSWKSFEVTGMVQQWISFPDQNNGFLLLAENEDVSGRDMRFFSKDSSDPTLRPYVAIEL